MVASPEIHLGGSPSRTFHTKQATAAGYSFHSNRIYYSHDHSLQEHHGICKYCFHHDHKLAHVTAVANKEAVLAETKASPKLLRL
jgi:hypothetical protein